VCVATSVGPIGEFMQHDVDGILVKSGEDGPLASAVCDLLADPKRRISLATNAKRKALGRFQPQEAAGRLTAIYEQVAAANRAKDVSSPRL
jgi:glycosyltransferase involved in cell wall biosynthesis